MKGMLVVNGIWREDNVKVMIINVYAPRTVTEKEQLWDVIKIVLEQNENVRVCIVGDFNSIREENERIGKRGDVDHRDIRIFENFISSSRLMELQLKGYRSCKSKLDRMMFFNGWTSHHDFQEFCKNKLEGYRIQGWKSYTLKEKLKLLKQDLEWWSKNTFGTMNSLIVANKVNIEKLDRIDDVFGLDEEEIIERIRMLAELKRNSIWKESFLFQKAKSKWIKEGDNFDSKRSVRIHLPEDLDYKKLDQCDNNFSLANFSEVEIKEAVCGCESNKTHGPDDF
ncbi:hypothetical protein ACS0TY_013006 [Phlomoides rotata]